MLITPPEFRHSMAVRVYYEDTDAGGIVFFTNYLKFMERGRTEWLRSLGIDQSDVAREFQRVFIVTGLDIRYKKSAKLDDLLEIHSVITRLGRASLHFAQTITRDGELLTESNIQIGCVDTVNMRVAAIPQSVRDKFAVTIQE